MTILAVLALALFVLAMSKDIAIVPAHEGY